MSKSEISSFSHFAFLPLNNFTMIAFSNAIEVLRMANYLEGKTLYRWTVVSPEGGLVCASNGLSIDSSPPDPNDIPDVVFVCGGTDIESAINAESLSLMQHFADQEVAMGSLCTGTFALAKAGLLDGYTCATHWENMSALRRAFPSVSFSRDLFVIDRDRLTCTGGIAPLDMMLNLISRQVGKTTIAAIADQFILEHVRDDKDQQRVPLTVRMNSARPAMVEVVSLMEANIEEPLSLEDLAQLSNSSPRQLQRMFKEHMGMSPTHYYLTLRLRKARELLRQTDMSILSITMACGFQSACHFSKTYREVFNVAPSSERRKQTPVSIPIPLLNQATGGQFQAAAFR
ncbi:GlxA family transcriptional regulator [Glaciimonas sp. CA11.2]|uniref:GlxA family transcriptional regulator n=1 Tax=unclassified Glaciimonas TaxID=2644401 RepID=UPI002AB402C6|nr:MULTISPECIES: GlxA family transcriptional regulator [unclassified Glaciimonas]MDY7547498.1 GlxA family transcriptional regulator [Glaciimonas sp. CA11.2]MEB0013465.1 GlxA family transcriptional regulator [Glaciimonas sp. Cout2]MEB0081544.1 GlxA family transcriptional regulator [Glaciimonas sp. Gout2]MEB0163251.1 GlxA family transcriptional regulator [Glaciimonas sp. CA11.2]